MDRRWLQVVAVALFINTSYGTLSYSFSVLITKEAAGGEFGTGLLSVAFGLALLVSGGAALFVGTIADLFGSRRLMLGGSLVGAAGLALLAASQEPWQVLAVMGVVVGPAMAATFYEPVYVLMNRWFDAASRPRAYGVLTLISGFSITIFTPLTRVLVDQLGWREGVVVLALILALVGTAVPMVIAEGAIGERNGPRASILRETWHGVRSGGRQFWAFTAAFFAANAAFSGFSFHAIAQLESRGFDAGPVANVIAIAGILSLPARLILPALSGRTSTTLLLCICTAGLAVAALLASVAAEWWQVWVYVVVFGAVFGAIYPLRALVTSEKFPGDAYGRLLGTQALFVAVSRAAGPALIGIYVGQQGSYQASFRVAAAVLAVSAVAIGLILGRRAPVVAGEAVGLAGQRR